MVLTPEADYFCAVRSSIHEKKNHYLVHKMNTRYIHFGTVNLCCFIQKGFRIEKLFLKSLLSGSLS